MSTLYGRTGISHSLSNPEQRVEWVNIAKGLCIILVVMMHSTLGMGQAVGQEGWLHHVVAFAKPFRIPAFFLVAGLFMARALQRNWFSYIDKRVVHFAYFYVLWLSIQSVFKYNQISDGSFLRFVFQYLVALIEPYGTLWFIYVLAIFSVMTKALMRLPKNILVGLAIGLHITHLFYIPLSSIVKWDLLGYVMDYYVYFVMGYIFSSAIMNYADDVEKRINIALIGIVIWMMISGLFALSSTGHARFETWASLPFIGLGLGCMGALGLIAISVILNKSPLSKILQYCGHHSIAIYLAFFLPMVITRTIFIKLGLTQDVGFASLIITIVAVATPLVIERIVRGTALDFLFVRPKLFHLKQKTTEAPSSSQTGFVDPSDASKPKHIE